MITKSGTCTLNNDNDIKDRAYAKADAKMDHIKEEFRIMPDNSLSQNRIMQS
jgi:hypothetical protein